LIIKGIIRITLAETIRGFDSPCPAPIITNLPEKLRKGTNVNETPLFQRKIAGGLENGLANLLNGRKIAKRPHVGRGQETQREMSDEADH
jgi:hypothetical protein